MKRNNVVSLKGAKKRKKQVSRKAKRQAFREMFVRIVKLRLKWLCVTVGTYLLITTFDLHDISSVFIPIGMVCILATLVLLVPYPLWWELEQGKERERFYDDEFKNGL